MNNQEIEQWAENLGQLVDAAIDAARRYRVARAHSRMLLRGLRETMQDVAGCEFDRPWWDNVTVMEYAKLYLATQPGVETQYIDDVICELSRHQVGYYSPIDKSVDTRRIRRYTSKHGTTEKKKGRKETAH